jgi:penicillin-insensitive murein endopeptidase
MRRWVLLAAIATGCRPGPSSEDAAARAEADGAATDEQGARTGPTASGPATTSERSGETKAGIGTVGDTKTGTTSAGDTKPAGTTSVATANPEPDPLTTPASRSTSIGTCTEGRLEGGIALPLTAPGLLFHPDKDPGSRFGTVELVAGLVRAAGAVERARPGAPLTVSDLAREGGGEISRHASHRSGRDVDVLFYLLREDGQPLVPAKAIPLDPEGRGTDYGDLADPADDVPVTLDAARTWSFLAALLADESAAVQRIFVVEHLRRRLLDEARRVEAPAELVQRFAEITCQPGFPHDDHMHVRVFCSAEDIAAGCIDAPPIYPWRTAALAEAGVEPVLAGRGDDEAPRPKRKPDIKTIEQARAEAGPMHEDVIAFLDRRQSWVKRPHPGRRWCR